MKFRKRPVVIEAIQYDGNVESAIACEHYPCKPDIFAATYDPVPDGL